MSSASELQRILYESIQNIIAFIQISLKSNSKKLMLQSNNLTNTTYQ